MLSKVQLAASVLMGCFATALPSSNSSNGAIRIFESSLSDLAEVYYPGSEEFANATIRWGAGQTPHYDMIVKVATEEDVQVAVRKRLLRSTCILANQRIDPIRQCERQAIPCHFGRSCDDDIPQQHHQCCWYLSAGYERHRHRR
jgi:hypothetical protein